jgi:NADH:ubiquinone reductase (H+-translocating)
MSPRIVILGGGFAGAYCAQRLEKRLPRSDADVTLIDRHNYFVFHPLLIEAGTGSLEPRHAVVPIRDFLRRTRFLMAEIESIDLVGRIVRIGVHGETEPLQVPFDHLVIAMGSITRIPPVPGLREHGLEMKDLADAVGLRDRIIQLLEQADACGDEARQRALLHLVVVGGNFTGVEVAGEFDMFLRRAIKRYPNLHNSVARITLIEQAERILGALKPELSEFATIHLTRRGVDVRLGITVTRVAHDHVVLSTGERLDTQTVIWAAGIAPNPLSSQFGLPLDDRGWIRCERDLRVQGFANIWSIGDLAVNKGPDGTPYPATAQAAIREGTACAENIVRVLKGQPTIPCDIENQGSIAALGCRTGVAEIFGIRLAGFPAWFLWRTVYLLKMPTLARKVRVALDWTLDLFFPHEVVQLGVHRTDGPESPGRPDPNARS